MPTHARLFLAKRKTAPAVTPGVLNPSAANITMNTANVDVKLSQGVLPDPADIAFSAKAILTTGGVATLTPSGAASKILFANTATLKAPVIGAVGAPPFAPVGTITGGTATVTNTAELVAAAKLSSNAGKTIGIATGTYAPIIAGSPGAPAGPASLVTFMPAPGATVTFSGMDLLYARHLRFEGIYFHGGSVDIQGANSTTHNNDLQFYGCEFNGLGGYYNGINAQQYTDNLVVEGCWFHDHSPDPNAVYPNGAYDTGYCLHLSGGAGVNTNTTIQSCKFGSPVRNDAIQLSSSNIVLVDTCEFVHCIRTNTASHPDAIQAFGTSNITLSNNYIHDWSIEQEMFFSSGWGGTCLVDNNLLRDTTTIPMWWAANWVPASHNDNFVSSGSITVSNNTIRAAGGGCYVQAWTGTPAFHVIDNVFNDYLDHHGAEGPVGTQPSMVVNASGNVVGGSPTFNADQECTSNPGKGYTKPAGAWW